MARIVSSETSKATEILTVVVLDTDHMTMLEWSGRPDTERLRARLDELGEGRVVTTIISYEEQVRGWMAYLAKARSLADQIERFRRLRGQLRNYCDVEILDFDEIAATMFQRLKQSRLRIGTKDLQIAAIVLVHDATLLTRNLADFRRVRGLKVEDWTM
jgi:tRNA(fMet)-specific endonuclease VapC